jgi:hypothetical protein
MYLDRIFLDTQKTALHNRPTPWRKHEYYHPPLRAGRAGRQPPVVATCLGAETTLKISHQFPGGTINEGDFRDRLTRMFAAEVEKRSKGASSSRSIPARR